MSQARQHLAPAWTPTRERAAPTDEGGRAPASAPRFLGSGSGSGVSVPPLGHPTTRHWCSAAVLGLQRTNGNAHVARLLIQRHDAVVGTDDEKKRFGEIMKVLEATPTGQEAIKVLDTHKVMIDFDASVGTSYDSSTNTIT